MQDQDLVLWSTLVGMISPLIVALIQQPKFNKGAKAVITMLYCLIAAAGTAYFEGRLTGARFATAFLIVFVAAIASFQGFWKPTGIADKVEQKTSPI